MTATMHAMSNQWRDRPEDERFWDVAELEVAANTKRTRSREVVGPLASLRFEPVEDSGIVVMNRAGKRAAISNLAFGQVASMVGLPAKVLMRLSNGLAVKCLNECVEKEVQESEDELEVQMLLDVGENVTIRSINSERYSRVHDAECIGFAKSLDGLGWKVPPARPSNYGGRQRPATITDVLAFGTGGVQIKVGDMIAPSGLYMGDRDLYVFMVDDQHAVDDGIGYPLMQGIVLHNSEVGKASFSITKFLAQGICGNHIIWGAKDIVQVRYRHIGEVIPKVREAMQQHLLNTGTPNLDKERQVFRWMRGHSIAETRQSVIDTVYRMRIPQYTQRFIRDVLDNAERQRAVDGDPYSWWGFANATTRLSQSSRYSDQRFGIDTAAATIFETAASLSGVK